MQRVLVERPVAEESLRLLLSAVADLVTGDPHDPTVDVGPIVDESAAVRVEEWIDRAVSRGAQLLTGGKHDGATIAPTVLTDVPRNTRIWSEEVFGPVLAVSIVADVQSALAAVNVSAYGLQAGVFTRDIQTAFHAHAALDVGGLIVGDVPSYRADQMPYGGLKASGTGREDILSAMTDLTEERLMVLTGLEL